MDAKKAAEFRLGIIVLVVLAVLTGVEYGISFTPGLWLGLIVIALIKAGIVMQYFMHIRRVFAEDGGH
jgi:heme/copper-type cytochrome/quinol oxidase subunit 4